MVGRLTVRVGGSRGLSLRARLVLLVLAAVVPLIVVTIERRYSDYRDAVAHIAERNLALARTMAFAVDEELQIRVTALRMLARSPALQAGDVAAFRPRAEVIAAEEFPGANLIVLRPDGQQLMNTLVPEGAPLPVRTNLESLRRMFDTGEPAISDLFQGAVGPRAVVAIDAPIKGEDGTVSLALSINPRLDDFGQLLRQRQIPPTWVVAVIDRRGVIVSRNQNAEQFVGHRASPELVRVLPEREGVLDAQSLEGIPVLSVFSHAERSGWAVAIGVPRSEITGPALAATTRTLAANGIMLLIGVGLALLVARQIARPIDALRRLAGSGDRAALLDPPPTGLPEADDVAQALRAAEQQRRNSEAEGRRALDTLHESERNFQYLFENSPMPKWVYDPSSLRFLAINDAAITMYGYSREEMLAMRIGDLLPPEDVERMQETVRRAGPYQQTYNWRHRAKDGRTIYFDGFSHSLMFEGKPARMVVVVDATARRTAEEQLLQSQKMEAVGQLTGGLAHDFNNLLQVIIGNLGLLLEDAKGNREIEELSGEAIAAAKRGAELTRSLLAFARRQPLQPRRVEVNALVTEVTKLLKRTLGERIEISLDLKSHVCPVVVDPVQLEATLANLATNARDAMPKGGQLVIATDNRRLDEDYATLHAEVVPGDYALIEVTDTGAGIPPDVMARVFEPFFTTKERGRGTGLGLSMVFGFMKQSGGHINVYSEVGVGTTFRLYLPCFRGPVEAGDQSESDPVPRGRGELVLVVDDDAAIRRLVVRQLNQLGYRAVEAENGTAALDRLAAEGAIDLVLTDVVMAGKIDGFDLAQVVAEQWPTTRVLLTSGFPDTAIVEQAAGTARIRLLSKPYRKEELARLVRDVLDGGDDVS